MPGNPLIGQQKVGSAAREMLGLQSIIKSFSEPQPFAQTSFLVCVTPTPETGVFLLALHKLGAKIAACSDNAFASDDDVVAYIQSQGVAIFAQSNMSKKQYFVAMEQAINHVAADPVLHIVDDGCDITQYIAAHCPQVFSKTRLITEQTTCGVNFLKALYAASKVDAPALNINHCFTKQWFDNKIGIQQSLIHALTNAGISLPGKTITIFGFGPIGQGAAEAMRSGGAQVNIVESNIIALMQAQMAGYTPIAAADALKISDICLTATGCVDTISRGMITSHARSGLILGNIGHGTVEYDVAFLHAGARHRNVNEYLDAYTLPNGHDIYSLCQGALVNFLAGGGNMPKVMSLTFTLTLLAHLEVLKSPQRLPVALHSVSRQIEIDSAQRNFPHLIDLLYPLNQFQIEYIAQE